MRTLSLLLPLSIVLVACIEDDEPSPPPVRFSELYSVCPMWCADCPILTLHRLGPELELRAIRPDGSFVGRQSAMLWPEANAELTELLEIDELGTLPKYVPTDLDSVQLSLPNLSLAYSAGHPPSQLVELDAFLMRLLDDLSHCRHTTRLDVPWECEPLAASPE